MASRMSAHYPFSHISLNQSPTVIFFFFFQAEDGIRDVAVTGVQTRALPISGVRNLERNLATICRKAARKIVGGETNRVRVTVANLGDYLGTPMYQQDRTLETGLVGVATGLAWTEYGGALLPVEVATMPGKGGLIITGQLGDVMQESARAALSFA